MNPDELHDVVRRALESQGKDPSAAEIDRAIKEVEAAARDAARDLEQDITLKSTACTERQQAGPKPCIAGSVTAIGTADPGHDACLGGDRSR